MYNIYLLVVLIVLLLSGCSTRNISLVPPFDKQNQTPNISLSKFKDVEEERINQEQNITVVAAISGGGHRAGNFGVGVLMALEDIKCSNKSYNVLKEVDYFSTVSGGGFAAGAYIASLHDHNQNETYLFSEKINSNKNEIRRNLERGYHNVLIEAFTKLKTLGLYDRGDYLETELDQKILGAAYRQNRESITFGDMFIEKNSEKIPILPIWIANATIYENGSIFPFYPGSFEKYQVTNYTHNVKKKKAEDYNQVPLSLGLKASATFPVAVPATTLTSSYDPNNEFIHLFDGGLSDNLGISTAVRLLDASKNKKRVLIIIDAYNGNAEPFSKNEASPFAIQIYNRATSISLDTWRIRHKWISEHFLKGISRYGEMVKVIYLAFEQADDDTRKLVEEIGTNFNIKDKEQEALFKAANQSVNKNANTIIEFLFDNECSKNL